MTPLTDDENKYYEEQQQCYISQKEFCYNKNQRMKFKLYKKVRDHCHFTGNVEELLIAFVIYIIKYLMKFL